MAYIGNVTAFDSVDTEQIVDGAVTDNKITGVASNKVSGLDTAISTAVAGIGATGGGNDTVFFENSTDVTTDYTLTANKNASSTGPISIGAGITVTVPTGARWVIL